MNETVQANVECIIRVRSDGHGRVLVLDFGAMSLRKAANLRLLDSERRATRERENWSDPAVAPVLIADVIQQRTCLQAQPGNGLDVHVSIDHDLGYFVSSERVKEVLRDVLGIRAESEFSGKRRL